jgi:hypothetical protein
MEQRGRHQSACANCRLEISWEPARSVEGMTFCCGGCARGGPCYCSYDTEPPKPAEFAAGAGTFRQSKIPVTAG